MPTFGPPPRGGQVRLMPEEGHWLTAILNAPPDRGGGVGGWQSSERAGRRPAKWWQNLPDDTISLDLTLDIDVPAGPSIEDRLRVLRDMGLPGEDSDPPVIRLDGDVWDDDKNVHWVMNDLTLGDRLFNADGTLRRQQVTVPLERFNPLSEIEAVRVHRTRSHGHRKHRTVKTLRHDTLRAVALRELGDATRWDDLRRWNKKLKRVDPDIALRTGTHIIIRK